RERLPACSGCRLLCSLPRSSALAPLGCRDVAPLGGSDMNTSVSITARSPSLAPARSKRALGPLLLFLTAWVYIGLVLLVPLTTLAVELFQLGLSTTFSATFTPDSWDSLLRSLSITAIVLVVNAVVGVGGALVIVRQDFPGRSFVSALVDLPLAVSPVMIGLGVLLVVGRDGLL